jgi:RimJ/RimL family protein N-acetyltransferase
MSPHTSPAGSDLAQLFPPFGVQVTSGPLSLRLLRDEDVPEYTELLRKPIFDRAEAAYMFDWYPVPEEERAKNSVSFQWELRSGIVPEHWHLSLGVWADGTLIGAQDITAKRFARTRTIGSGSWLTLDAHGKGYGGLMRRMVLALAFDHLGARRAESEAEVSNVASFAVSRSCGYQPNGDEVVVERNGNVVTRQRFVVTPETFVRRDVQIEVTGLAPELRVQLGVDPAADGEVTSG